MLTECSIVLQAELPLEAHKLLVLKQKKSCSIEKQKWYLSEKELSLLFSGQAILFKTP